MPHYRRVEEVLPKRHTRFRQPEGSLYAEEEPAVMIDSFRPLSLEPGARDSEDDDYAWSGLGGR